MSITKGCNFVSAFGLKAGEHQIEHWKFYNRDEVVQEQFIDSVNFENKHNKRFVRKGAGISRFVKMRFVKVVLSKTNINVLLFLIKKKKEKDITTKSLILAQDER